MVKYLENNPRVVVYTANILSGKISYVSTSAFSVLGYQPDKFYKYGLNLLFSKIHADDYPRIFKRFRSKLSSAANKRKLHILKQEFRFLTASNEWIWIENLGVILNYSEDNQSQDIMGFLNPIEDQDEKYNRLQPVQALFESGSARDISKILRFRSELEESTQVDESSNDSLKRLFFLTEEKVEISDREKEILQHVGNGLSTKEIAKKLFISETTVVTHRKSLMEKFAAKNTAELIKKASKMYWLE